LGLSAAAVLIALLLYGPMVRLLGGEPALLIAFCVGLPGYALCFVVRGMLSGSRRLGRYGLQLSVEGTIRLVGLGLMAAVGVSSAAAFGWLFAAAPWVAVGACLIGLPRGGTGSSTRRAPAPLVAAIGLLLVSSLAAQLLIGAGPVTAQLFAGPADQARTGAFLAALVVVRVPILLFTAVQPSMLPALSAHVAGDRRAGFVSLLGKVLAGMATLAVGTVVVTAGLGPWALRVIFGSDFVLSTGVFLLMGISVGLFLVAVVLSQGVLALGHHRWVTVGWLCGLVGLVAGTMFAADPVLRATLGLMVGAAFAAAAFAALLWRALRGWQPAGIGRGVLADPAGAH
jgi:O-antigen/teichoic acid export membrane protein